MESFTQMWGAGMRTLKMVTSEITCDTPALCPLCGQQPLYDILSDHKSLG